MRAGSSRFKACEVGFAFALLCLPLAAPHAVALCVGDCNRDGRVRIHEVQRSANVFRGAASPSTCTAADRDASGHVEIDEVHAAVRSFLVGPESCPMLPPTANEVCFRSQILAAEAGGEPTALAAGDFNADGFADLIVVNSASNSLTQLNNDGTGSFAPFGPMRFVGADTFPAHVATFRKNSDDFDDFVVVREPTEEEESSGKCLGCATFWESDEEGTFIPSTVAVGLDPIIVRAGDLDGDGRQDLVVVNSSDDSLSVLGNDPAGSFFDRISVATSPFVVSATIADVDGDDALDLVGVGLDGIAIHINQKTTPPFQSCPQCSLLDAGIVPAAIEASDMNEDEKVDLLVSDGFLSTIQIRYGVGDGTFGAPMSVASPVEPGPLAIADFNLDGHKDVATVSPSEDVVAIFLGDAQGTYTAFATLFTTGSGSNSLVTADFNHDGRPDLAVTAELDDSVTVLLNEPCSDSLE